MNTGHWKLIHELVSKSLADELSASEHEELVELLRNDPEARRTYVAHLQESAELRWLSSGLADAQELDLYDAIERGISLSAPSDAGKSTRWLVGSSLVVAASICIFVGGYVLDRIRQGQDPSPPAQAGAVASEKPSSPFGPAVESVATLTRLTNVTWPEGLVAFGELSRLHVGDTISVESGRLEIVFDGGVVLVARGKSQFRIVSALHVIGEFGTLSARVGQSGRGFTIDTPNTRIIDRGTEFGVSIDPDGQTDVVCFQGMVELDYRSEGAQSRSLATQDRLNQGEGLRIDASGTASRLVCTNDTQLPLVETIPRNSRSLPVIAAVRDTIPNSACRKSYRIVHGGLDDDALAFVDRPHEWNGLDESGMPDFLRGCDYVMPFNDDKHAAEDIKVQVDIARPAIVYLFLSDIIAPPNWLRKEFEDTGVNIGLDEGPYYKSTPRTWKVGIGPGKSIDTVFSVWKCEVDKPTTLELGGMRHPDAKRGYNMYGIAAKPLVHGGN